MLDEASVRALLEARLDELQSDAKGTSEDRKPVELDQTSVGRLSRMDSMQVQAMAQATEQRRRQEIQRIGAALKRLEDGEYGYCLTCGEEISDGRLAVDPTASVCIKCASNS